MDLSELTAISPIDGRYRSHSKELSAYFSEYALHKYRMQVEVEYFIALSDLSLPQLGKLKSSDSDTLKMIYKQFSVSDTQRLKELEKVTNHDVKAVEYFLKEKFTSLGFEKQKEFIHFGLTSQDINNTAIPLAVKDAVHAIYLPMLNDVLAKIKEAVAIYSDVSMLSRTHGQPASPTRLGKEFAVFVERIENQKSVLISIPYAAKFGGATGNFNAHFVAYPNIDWKSFADNFVNNVLGLHRSQFTTQIEHYDSFASLCDAIKRINTILMDFCRDMWSYISMDYFKQKIKESEIGSSAMPHKVNPIDFENAEGNLGMANAILEHFSSKLPISRLQRDLTDSTVMRNIGVPFSHSVIAYKSILKGMDKLLLNKEKINRDLEDNWVVVAEGIQTILRRENFPDPYETIKNLTRTNQKLGKEILHDFIDKLEISASVKEELKSISPYNYTGI
jgi:adenylosuccinate lyase